MAVKIYIVNIWQDRKVVKPRLRPTARSKWSRRGCRYCTFKSCPKPTQLDHKHLVKRHFVSELKPGCLESNVVELCLSGRAIYKCIFKPRHKKSHANSYDL